MALSEVGLKPWEFWQLRPADLALMSQYNRQQWKRHMIPMRETVAAIYNVALGFSGSKKSITGYDVYPLDGEEKPKTKSLKDRLPVTSEEWDALNQAANRPAQLIADTEWQ